MTPAPTRRTAVVLVPPRDAWDPVQAIRRRHDRHVARWMPHVTLLHPFAPEEAFDEVSPLLAGACARVAPFPTTLAVFRSFDHGRGRSTLWLAPEPAEPLAELHAALHAALPGFDETPRHAGGFVPHLSVGQASTRDVPARLAAFGRGWAPLRFDVREVALLRRDEDGPFEIARTFALGAGA